MDRKSQRSRKVSKRSTKVSNTSEETYDLAGILKKAEDAKSPWPQLSDDAVTLTQTSKLERRSGPQEELAKVATWTMAGVVGAVTIYAITTGNEKLLMALLVMAAPFLIRLALKGAENDKSKKNKRDHHSDDS